MLPGNGGGPVKKTKKPKLSTTTRVGHGAGVSKTNSATHPANVKGNTKAATGAGGTAHSTTQSRPTHSTNLPTYTPKPKPLPQRTDDTTAVVNAARKAQSAGQGAKLAASQKKASKPAPAPVSDVIPTGGPAPAPTPSVLDGLTAPDISKIIASTSKDAKTRGLQDYIKTALKDMGAGTDYAGLSKQLKADTATNDGKVKAMYSALTLGIRANDPILKGIYDDAANQTKAAGAQAQSTVQGAYAAAQGAVSQRMAAVGAPGGDSVTAQWAAADQGNNQAALAANQQSSLDANTQHETAARVKNTQDATGAGFAGTEARAGIAQGLADNLTKLNTQKSTEDASRRAQALQMAISMQGNDQQAASDAQKNAIDAANTTFSQRLALAQARLNEQNTNADNSRADYDSQVSAADKAAGRTQAGQRLSLDEQKAQDARNNQADQNAVTLKKLELQTAGQSKSRKAAAAKALFDKNQMTADQYRKYIKKLG